MKLELHDGLILQFSNNNMFNSYKASKRTSFSILFFVFIWAQTPLNAQTNYKLLAEETFQEIIKEARFSGPKIEQLKAIPISEVDSIKYIANSCIGVYYGILLQHDSAVKYFNEALSLVEPKSIQWARTYQKLAIIKRQQGKYNEALALLSEVIEVAEASGDNITIATILSEMASNYNSLYNRNLAIKNLIKSIEAIEKMSEPNEMQLAIQKHNLANFYSQNQNFDLANKLYDESIKLFKKLGAKQSIALSLMNYGECLLNQQKFVSAEKMIIEGLVKLKELGNTELVAISYLNLAILNQKTNKTDAAINTNYLLSLKEAGSVNSPRTLEIVNNYIDYLNQKNQYSQAVLLGNKYATYKDKAHIKTLHFYYGNMGKAYAGIGDYETAAKNYALYGSYGDSLMESEQAFLVSQIHENYAQELHKKENKSLLQANQILEQEGRIKLFIFLSFGAILLCITLYLWSKINKVRYTNEVLSLKIKVEDAQLKQTQQELKNERALLKMKEEIIEVQKKELHQLSKQGSAVVAQIDAIMVEKPSEQFQKTSHSIKEAISNQFWEQFNQRFQGVFPTFYASVQTKFGAIFTEEDLQHMALHKLDLSLSEIAHSLSISAVQAELTKQNILKKCKITEEDTYTSILTSLT